MTIDRDALAAVIGDPENPGSVHIPGTGWIKLPLHVRQEVADAVIAHLSAIPVEGDPRDVAHIACDCVPDLGPEHCHLCGKRGGLPVAWTECSSRKVEVTTAEELDALPLDSVVVDFAGVPRTKRAGNSHMPGGWTHAGNSPLTSRELADGNPLRVIHSGRLARWGGHTKGEA